MLTSSLDNQRAEIKTNEPVNFDLTHFSIKGSTLQLEGYISINNLYSYSEERIRKTLTFIPEIDVEQFREAHRFEDKYDDLSDDEILKLHIIEIPLDNCQFKDVVDYKNFLIKDIE